MALPIAPPIPHKGMVAVPGSSGLRSRKASTMSTSRAMSLPRLRPLFASFSYGLNVTTMRGGSPAARGHGSAPYHRLAEVVEIIVSGHVLALVKFLHRPPRRRVRQFDIERQGP